MNENFKLTESGHGQNECDHDGDPGDPQCFLPVALSLMGLQAHAALKKTCNETQKIYYKNKSFFLVSDHIGRPEAADLIKYSLNQKALLNIE